VATVYGFLKQFGLEKEIKVNIEANHATLAGHSFHHEIASAIALGIFGLSMRTAAMRSWAGIPISSRTAWKRMRW
jgi:xylose isomerase